MRGFCLTPFRQKGYPQTVPIGIASYLTPASAVWYHTKASEVGPSLRIQLITTKIRILIEPLWSTQKGKRWLHACIPLQRIECVHLAVIPWRLFRTLQQDLHYQRGYSQKDMRVAKELRESITSGDADMQRPGGYCNLCGTKLIRAGGLALFPTRHKIEWRNPSLRQSDLNNTERGRMATWSLCEECYAEQAALRRMRPAGWRTGLYA